MKTLKEFMIDHISMDESWINGITSKPSFNLKKQITKYKEKASNDLKNAGIYASGSEKYYKHMSSHHSATAKYIKSSYHAGDYGNKDSAKKDHDTEMERSKFHANKIKELSSKQGD